MAEKKKKKGAGINSIEQGFLDASEPSILSAASAAAGISPHELKEQLAEVGIEVPDKPEKQEVPIEETGVGSVESGFTATPVLDPVEGIEIESYSVSPKELERDLEAVGIEIPERPHREKKVVPVEETGVGQVEAGYLQPSPLDILAAASAGPVVSHAELEKELAEVGIEVPEKPKKEKKEHHGLSGVDIVEEGFLAEPEMSIVEELGSIRYAASPKEINEEIEQVEEEYGRHEPRLTLNEALLAKLRESGYTGDLEALKKLADELK